MSFKHSFKSKAAILGFHEGNAGQVAEWFEAVSGLELVAFVDEQNEANALDIDAENKNRVSQRMDWPRNGQFKGLPLVSGQAWIDELRRKGVTKVIPLISDNAKRRQIMERARAAGFDLVSAIHPTAIILDQAIVEAGVWVNAGCIVGYKAEVRQGVLINTAARIDHHSILEECSQIDPGVITAGHVTVQKLAHVHTGAVIINRITIGERAVVGAGAVVIRNVPDGAVVAGVPARPIKSRV